MRLTNQRLEHRAGSQRVDYLAACKALGRALSAFYLPCGSAWAFLEHGRQAADHKASAAAMEEAKKDDEVTIADLKEVIDGQSHRIDALTSLVRAQQVTMDRLLRAVEKGAAIPPSAVPPPAPQAYAGTTRQAYAPSTSSRTGPTGYGASPQAYGPGSASDPSAARAREHAQRLEAERQRGEAARRAHAERLAQEQREREARAQRDRERQDQLRREAEARAEAQRKEREALAAKRAEEARLKKEAEEAERRKIEAAKKAQQAKLAASRSKVLGDLVGSDDEGENSLFGSSPKAPASTSSLFD